LDLLMQKLLKIDLKGYKAYKEIIGTYKGEGYLIHIDHVQSDPFAPPSRIRIEVPRHYTKYENEWYDTFHRKTALEDFLARQVSKGIRSIKDNQKGYGKSGLIYIDSPRQEIIPRSCVKVSEQKVEFRMSVGLPSQGRTVLGHQAVKMLCHDIPLAIKDALSALDTSSLMDHLKLSDQQQAIRQFIEDKGYIAFMANGSILPRQTGISSLPLRDSNVVAFIAPKSLEIEIPIPHSSPIRGMALPKGITIIAGGGYHGKSTLLKAIERGVYNHILGDGREFVITDHRAYKIRAEDGRSIEGVDISPFISNLPHNKSTTAFRSQDASGSTSQAANIIEAMEGGSRVLLIDEDTSATNFMIRDGRMQRLVAKDKEPITPFVDKVELLYKDYGISTVVVIGGSGDYFEGAHRVIMMDEYVPKDVTIQAKEISSSFGNTRKAEGGQIFGKISPRIVLKQSLNPSIGSNKEKLDCKGLCKICYGKDEIDLSFVEQLVDDSQTRAISYMIRYIYNKLADDKSTLPEIVDCLYKTIEEKGLDIISPYYGKHPGDLALPRSLELISAINRLRSLRVK
jgi:predicted ABC-class ATPase